MPRVSYGFYRDQFYAAFIRLRSPDQFAHLQRQFSKKHGKPKVTQNAASGQTVYRWKVEDVKIKLKMKESIGEYKLAFYYSPLSTELNRELLEQIPAGGQVTNVCFGGLGVSTLYITSTRALYAIEMQVGGFLH